MDKATVIEFWVKMAKMTFKVKAKRHLFSIPDVSILACMFGASLLIPAQICDELSHRQAEFPRILR